ncbi:MAG TPA: hypothetical protein DCR82_07150 [Eubacterium sp.]|nr:hypothetical protein [Eubacterium sp.]
MDSTIQKIYKAAIYLRLSREDGDVAEGSKEISNSIANQKELVMDYLKSHPEITICDIYTDDGYSGVNFDRPGFQKMIKDIRDGKANCIIVKDLSRFGRNYIESGRYIEKIFPMLGVRFIAITDNYDSETSEDGYGTNMIIPFKNLINDAYARDISVKVRTNLQIKRKNGDYIGNFVVYGYLKDPDNKNKLIVDEYAGEIVKDIYAMKVCGMSQQAIADKLNKNGILCPYEYKKSLGIRINDNFKKKTRAVWSYNAVLRILKNEIYTGTLIQGRCTTPNYKVKKKVVKSENEWVRVENNHEPIITKEQFDIVQELLIRDTRVLPETNAIGLLGGVVYCADCGRAMVRKTVPAHGKKYIYYVCSSNKKDKNICSSHRISMDKLTDIVCENTIKQVNLVMDYAKELEVIEQAAYMKADVRKYDKLISKKKEEIQKYQTRKLNLYDDYKDGILDKQEYMMFKSDYDKKLENCENEVASYEADKDMILDNKSEAQKWIGQFRKMGKITELTRNAVAVLIDKVFVYSSDRIEIDYKFDSSFETMKKYVDAYSPNTFQEMEAI